MSLANRRSNISPYILFMSGEAVQGIQRGRRQFNFRQNYYVIVIKPHPGVCNN